MKYPPSPVVNPGIAQPDPKVDPLLDRSMNAKLYWITFEMIEINPSFKPGEE